MTKTKTETPTVPTETFLDVFRTIATEHSWCDEAEGQLERNLGLTFQPYGDDWCCADHSGHLRFRPAEGTPDKLDATLVSEKVKMAVRNRDLSRKDAERLLALLPEDLRLPPNPTVTVTFTVGLEDWEADRLAGRSTWGVQRYLAERLHNAEVRDFTWKPQS